MDWYTNKAVTAFDRLKDFRIDSDFNSTQYPGFHLHHVFDDEKNEIIGFILDDENGFNELFFEYKTLNQWQTKTSEQLKNPNVGDLYLNIKLDKPLKTILGSWIDVEKIPEILRFLGKKKDYENKELVIPHVILSEFFDLNRNCQGTAGMLKKYWHYPSVISYAITPFNACIILKSKQKYFAYFYSHYPERTFLRIDIDKAFKIIQKLQDKKLDRKEIPEQYKLDIIAGQI